MCHEAAMSRQGPAIFNQRMEAPPPNAKCVKQYFHGSRKKFNDTCVLWMRHAGGRKYDVMDNACACEKEDEEMHEVDITDEQDIEMINEGEKEDKGQRLRIDDKGIQGMTHARRRLEIMHYEMQELEEHAIKRNTQHPSCDDSKAQLQRLRQQRVRRPRILFSYAVSSHTGHGLAEFRKALATLLNDKRLFPHVGGIVPLNYAMLERVAHKGCSP
mmetsp:Transcript_82512/g.133813  ORF Transcript_82512/g.133813 Transcript_82512/m.133813 type:complete len:215 (+) Transcript_82512:339-983(+)